MQILSAGLSLKASGPAEGHLQFCVVALQIPPTKQHLGID